MIWRIIFIGIGLIMFFYGANLAIEMQLDVVKTSQDPANLIFGSLATLFVLALGLMGLGGTLIFVGAVVKRKQNSPYYAS